VKVAPPKYASGGTVAKMYVVITAIGMHTSRGEK
jgi:hypothetical protein